MDAGNYSDLNDFIIVTLIHGVEKAEKVAETINSNGGYAMFVAGDITKNEYIKHLVRKTIEFSAGKIHIIINNAGYAWDDPIEKIQDKQWGKSL